MKLQQQSELQKNESLSPNKLSEKLFKRQKEAGRYRGVRRCRRGRFGAEIHDPKTKERRWLGNYDTAEEAACAYDFSPRAMSGIKARTNFIYLNSEHCMLSTPTPPASLTGSTFPTNIKDPFSHKPQKLQESWLDCLWRDSSTTRPSPCDEAK